MNEGDRYRNWFLERARGVGWVVLLATLVFAAGALIAFLLAVVMT